MERFPLDLTYPERSLRRTPLRTPKGSRVGLRVPPAAKPAVTEWYYEHGPMVQGVVRAYVKDPYEMEELLQEVWLRTVDRAHHIQADGHIKKRLFLLTRTVCRDHLRKKGRRKRLFRDWVFEEATVDQLNPPPTIEAHFQQKELWAEVDRLPVIQREVLLLRVVRDLTVAETAQSIGRPEGSVRAYLSFALRTLRARYHSHD